MRLAAHDVLVRHPAQPDGPRVIISCPTEQIFQLLVVSPGGVRPVAEWDIRAISAEAAVRSDATPVCSGPSIVRSAAWKALFVFNELRHFWLYGELARAAPFHDTASSR